MEQKIWTLSQEKAKETGRLLSARQKRLSSQIESNQLAMTKLLEEGAKGYLPDANFQDQLSRLHAELRVLWNELNTTNEQARKHKVSRKRDSGACLALIQKHLAFDEINRSLVLRMVERIVVCEAASKDKKRNLEVTIKYRFSC